MASVLGTLLFSVSASQVAPELLDKASEVLVGTRAKDLIQGAQRKLKAYVGDVPGNHDLEQAIRYAELVAALALLRNFRRRDADDHFDDRAAQEPPFIEAGLRWLHGQIPLCPSLQGTPDHEIMRELNGFPLDPALAATQSDDVNAALAEATDKLWREMAQGVADPVPADLEDIFFGRAEEPGWAVLFVAFMRDQLKDRPRAQAEFVVTRLAAACDTLRRVETEIVAVKDNTGKLVASVEGERQRLRVAEGFVLEAAGRIGVDSGLDFDGKVKALRNAIELYATEIAGGRTHTNLGAIVDQALANAKRLTDDGKSGLARAALRTAAESLRHDEEERRSHYTASVRLLHGRERDIALAAFDGDGAAAAIVALAEALGDGADARRQMVRSEAVALRAYGRDRGSNVHLMAEIALRRWLLESAPSAEIGGERNGLGIALATLGERERGTARLEEAVAAFCAALEERTRERVPLDWAMTQNNLGNALRALDERENGPARLEEAVAAYRAALEERTRERVPLAWAMTQNNLGNALQTLGERESGTARLEEAVAAFCAALEERTRERVPLAWAMTQNNLGNALATLGERESGTARLKEALAAYRAALAEQTRERVPLDWAGTQNNLGAALQTLGERESGTARLEEAVAAYRAALEEWTPEAAPYQHDGARPTSRDA